MTDQPLWSWSRLWGALRRWLWWGCEEGMWFPFWYWMRYDHRPEAEFRETGLAPLDIWRD